MGPNLNPNALLLTTISLSGFLTGFDYTALNVAIPSLTQLFHSTYSITSWVLLAYALVFVALAMPVGNLIGIFGAKRLLGIGFGIYAVGSICCALAPGINWLVVFRALQAVGGAILFVSGPALVRMHLPEDERGRGYGVAALAPTIGIFAGPALGAFILSEFGWRWIFVINLPVCALGFYLVRLMPFKTPTTKPKVVFDIPGSVLLFVGLISAVFAINQGTELGWTSSLILSAFGIAAVCLSVFVIWELGNKNAAMDLRILANPRFRAGAIAIFLYLFLYGGLNFSLPIFLSQVKGLSINSVGSVIAIQPLTILIITVFIGLVAKLLPIGTRNFMGSSLLIVALVLALQDQLTSGIWLMMVVLVLMGAGQALYMPALLQLTLEPVEHTRAAQANGILTTLRTLGQLVGVVSFETMMSGSAGANNVQISQAIGDHSAFRSLFWFALGLSVAAAAASIWLVYKTNHTVDKPGDTQ